MIKLFLTLITALLFLNACSKVDLLNATIPASGYHVVKDVPYGSGDRRTLDIYVPDVSAQGHPVIVFFYGGRWEEGSKDDYLFVGQAFASQGFITVIADYRLFPEVYFPEFMRDAAASFVWTHNHIAEYAGDPRNIFVAGHSAGGYNAIMLALNRRYLREARGDDRWIRGGIGIAGAYDFLPLTDPDLIEMFSKTSLEDTQPISFARPNCPPLLLLTGNDDEDVLPRNAFNLTSKLRALGDDVTLITYPGLAHIGIALSLADGFRDKAPVLKDISAFINNHALQESSP